MKKFIILTALLILVLLLTNNPSYGQRGKRSGMNPKVVDTVFSVSIQKTELDTESIQKIYSRNPEMTKILARMEKLEKSMRTVESDVKKIKTDLRGVRISTLDSMLKLRRDGHRTDSSLGSLISGLSNKMKLELASNAEFIIKLKEKVDAGDVEAREMMSEL